MSFDKSKYDQQYMRENCITKRIQFNKNNADDVELLAWITSRDESVNQYIKRLIREDIEKSR